MIVAYQADASLRHAARAAIGEGRAAIYRRKAPGASQDVPG